MEKTFILLSMVLALTLSGCGNIKPTTTWKTYNNEIHKFKIVYPSNWLLQKEEGHPPATIISRRFDDNGYCSLNLNIMEIDIDLSGEIDWYRQHGYQEQEYIIDSKPGIKFSKFPVENSAPEEVIFFDNNTDRIDVVASADKYEECQQIFNKMLSSYKSIQ